MYGKVINCNHFQWRGKYSFIVGVDEVFRDNWSSYLIFNINVYSIFSYLVVSSEGMWIFMANVN